jgi:outer membrane lipoprotein-sorting protein
LAIPRLMGLGLRGLGLMVAVGSPSIGYAQPPAAVMPHAAVITDANAATVRQVEAALNGLRTLKARFLQIGPDGGTSTGTVWLQRPGRMRFQYDPPSPLLLVAGHGLVVFRDNKLDQTSNIPMGETPLGLLLRDTITLSGDVTVTDFQQPPGLLQITLVKTKSPGDGSLTLTFDANPLALTGWSVVDAQGRETRIRLTDVKLGGTFDQSLFTYIDMDALTPGGNTP